MELCADGPGDCHPAGETRAAVEGLRNLQILQSARPADASLQIRDGGRA